jgi:hypothetical protein
MAKIASEYTVKAAEQGADASKKYANDRNPQK